MIQRIQTVYLFLTMIFTLLFITFPVGSLQIGDAEYLIKIWSVTPDGYKEFGIEPGFLGYVASVIAIIVMIVSIYTTFQFRKRLFQIKLGKMNILLNVMLVVLTFFYLDSVREDVAAQFSYKVGVVFPLLSMILILMANRAIRRDENMVRAADRLR
jgi:hypothetical protein